jgi:cephalosporin-C deacetylase-like acetyl esterase
MNRILFLFILPLTFSVQPAFPQTQPSSVFYSGNNNRQWHSYRDNHRALYKIITNEAFKKLEERDGYVSSLTTKSDWLTYQDHLKKNFCSSQLKFEKTPLNAKTTGILERETFLVEKIIFESQPGFYITAGLFIPKVRQQPAPAVIYACGHTELGFRSETYQHVILNLVEKGFIVLAFDPAGQGERLLYPDPETAKSKIGGSTAEHSYAGIQSLLKGTSLTDYFIWDGLRVLDYLETRKEVDMKRVGMTGRSGGGTQTAQIAACDDRIYAAAPENYITSFKRLLQSIGPQDAEQNPYRFIQKGFDHADYLHARAPKPLLILTTTNDFFSIQGARETFAEVRKAYIAMEKPDNIRMTEDTGSHESTKNNREALYAFFQKHLDLPGNSSDNVTTPFTVKELQVTPSGQVVTSYKGETIFSLNKKLVTGTPKTGIEEQIIITAGIKFERTVTSAVHTGNFTMNGIQIQKYFLETNKNDYALPVYVIHGEKQNNGAVVVWFHPGGKQQILNEKMLSSLLKEGHTIVCADLPGTGELRDPEFTGDGTVKGVPFNYVFGANLAGKSVTGIMAEGIDLLNQFIENKNRFQKKEIYAIVQEAAASAFLHYAILNNPFSKTAFIDFPGSASKLLTDEYFDPVLAFTIPPGSLNFYDLPDLIEHLEFYDMKVHYDHAAGEGVPAFFRKQ